MRRSLRTQLTVGGVALAALAVAVTTWVVATATSADLVGDVDDRLEERLEIETALAEYAVFSGTWVGVEDLVDDLAIGFNTRVALTTADGRLLADSDPNGPDVVATSIIDPTNPLMSPVFSESSIGNIEELNELIAGCLDEADVAFVLDDGDFGVPAVVVEIDESMTDTEIESALATEAGCYEDAASELGDAGLAGVFDEQVAEPAVLFLVGADRPAVNWVAVVATAVVILALMAALVWWASRRVTGPLVALSNAARRIRQGDLSTRVDVPEAGELGELAESFNEMAAELDDAAGRRRRFTSDVAHELRTPLANITSHVEALIDGVEEPSEEILGVVRGEVDHVVTLVDDLQQLTLVDEGRLEIDRFPVVLDDVVEQVTEANRLRAAEAGVALVQIGAAPEPIELDPIRIRQAIDNLVSNAVRHTPPDGAVTVAVSQSVDETVVAVRDTGPGIPEEFLSRIFQRFSRADESRSRTTGGSGLGLSIAHELIRAHGGTIGVSNMAAGGAEFVVRLPSR